MKILILGLGVIGTTYGYLFKKAGHNVKHFIRNKKKSSCPKHVDVNILDGSLAKAGLEYSDKHEVIISKDNSHYDFIFVSVSSGKLREAIISLKEKNITGTIVLFCNFWETRKELDKIMNGYSYIIGFPTAGGNIKNNILNCVVFDGIMLERYEQAKIEHYDKLVELFEKDSKIKIEHSYDMVEWIWIHMAINAGVTSTAGSSGDLSDPKNLANNLMDSTKLLKEAIISIRETLKVVKARGVKMRKYKKEILPYKIPRHLASYMMMRLFKKNQLTRRIMTLHNDTSDLVYGSSSVFKTGKELGVKMPNFSKNMNSILEKLNNEIK